MMVGQSMVGVTAPGAVVKLKSTLVREMIRLAVYAIRHAQTIAATFGGSLAVFARIPARGGCCWKVLARQRHMRSAAA